VKGNCHIPHPQSIKRVPERLKQSLAGSSRPRAARSGPLPVTQSPSCLSGRPAAAVSRASRPVACWRPTELASHWRTDAAWDGSRRHGEPRALQGWALPRGAAGKGAALGGRQGGPVEKAV
jgi:hypothetical protein